MRNDLLVGVFFLLLVLELCRLCRQANLQKLLFHKARALPAKAPRQLKPKSEKACPHCQAYPSLDAQAQVPRPPSPRPWKFIKGKGGRKKWIATEGYARPNPVCDYDAISDASIHAVVGYGTHGKQEDIQDLYCQASKHKFTARRHTPATCTQVQAVLHRLKTHSNDRSIN
jgi:hypothetical protein